MYSLIAQVIENIIPREIEVEFRVQSTWEDEQAQQANLEALQTGPEHRIELSRASLTRAKSEANLQSYTTFDTMVVGECNEYAYAIAIAVSDEPATYENPLVIYGAVGMGKTHIMQAVGHRYLERHLRVMYQTTTEFTSDFTRAIRERERPIPGEIDTGNTMQSLLTTSRTWWARNRLRWRSLRCTHSQ